MLGSPPVHDIGSLPIIPYDRKPIIEVKPPFPEPVDSVKAIPLTPRPDTKLYLFPDSTLGIIGDSPAIQRVRSIILQVAPLDSKVFITGETGTGKELVAKAIHLKSRRSDQPFIAVNCAAISENMIEAELFGHEKGAYTGATKRRIGLLEAADKGTVFLDEIGELSPALQAKLNRFLEDGSFQRVGSTENIKTDVRVIAATNCNLKKAIEEKRFRKDLFYRLNVIPLHMPPLRDRTEDIPELAEHFLEKHKMFVPDKVVNRFSPEAVEKLRKYEWPGNVRELENIVRRSIIFAKSPIIQPDDITITTAETEIKALERIEDIALSNASIIICGETGVGKEVTANQIQQLSRRRDKPFVVVNCATLQKDLAESQLFGHEEGSFTNACEQHKGFFETADGGTLFLDEVRELSPDIQVKLLRVLQEGEITPVGANFPKKVNVRIMAATNCDLEKAVKDGSFREDLFHRLNVIPVRVPPLRKHKERIPGLAAELLQKCLIKICPGKNIPSISEEAMQKLIGHDWPGNIRELENTIARACVSVKDGCPIQAEHITFPSSGLLESPPNKDSGPNSVYRKYKLELDVAIERSDRALSKILLLKLKIVKLIIDSTKRPSEILVAREMDLNRNTVRSLAKKHGYKSTNDLISQLYDEIFPAKSI